MLVSSSISGADNEVANLVLIDDPAFVFFVPAIMTATVFDDLIDG